MLIQKFLKRPVSVVNTSNQQLYQHCKIKCLTEFVVISTNSHCIPVWQRVLTQIFLSVAKTIGLKLSAPKVLDMSVFILCQFMFSLYSKYLELLNMLCSTIPHLEQNTTQLAIKLWLCSHLALTCILGELITCGQLHVRLFTPGIRMCLHMCLQGSPVITSPLHYTL